VPEVRRSFSEPSVVGRRRGALELSRESLDALCARRGFAMAGAESTQLQRCLSSCRGEVAVPVRLPAH
jgi:hypothetical protein